MKRLLLFLCLAGAAHAGEPAPCRAEARLIVVPGPLARGLLGELCDEQKAPVVLARIDGMIARGEAELAAVLRATGAERQHLEGFAGTIYHYRPEVTGPPDPAAALEITPPKPQERPLGGLMEVALTRTATPGVLAASFDLQHVRLEKVVSFPAGSPLASPRPTMSAPEFSVVHINGQSTFTGGRPKLVGAQLLPGGEGKMEFFFLTLTAPSP